MTVLFEDAWCRWREVEAAVEDVSLWGAMTDWMSEEGIVASASVRSHLFHRKKHPPPQVCTDQFALLATRHSSLFFFPPSASVRSDPFHHETGSSTPLQGRRVRQLVGVAVAAASAAASAAPAAPLAAPRRSGRTCFAIL